MVFIQNIQIMQRKIYRTDIFKLVRLAEVDIDDIAVIKIRATRRKKEEWSCKT
ncbi:MAG: hypothetical protein CM15mV93_160 [Caudoviricetes sp.]|nr:MAG: hypothetical protein CM15mV93_160 [Caudoviricetes sp.]